MAVRTGLEPATHGVTGRYSNQLNYRTIFSYFDNDSIKIRIVFSKLTTLFKEQTF